MRVFIVDDEAPARRRLSRLLLARPSCEIVGEAGNGIEALEAIAAIQPDVVFLDIEMPELDGFGVAAALQGPLVVFVTAYDEYALKAFETNAVDYLVKPVAEARLDATLRKLEGRKRGGQEIERLLASLERPRARMAVRCGNRFVVIDTAKISAVISRDHYSAVMVDGKEWLSDDSLEELQSRLDPRQFVRAHRGVLVNLDFVSALEREGDRKYVAILGDTAETRVPVSRERLPDVKRLLGVKIS